MSKSRQPIDWNRLVIEGLVIVVSILLAFAIDAWWDQRREVRATQDQVARVVAELRANMLILKGQDEALEFTTQAARDFLSIMGPDAEPVSTREVGSMIARIYSVGTLSLSRSATQDFLSSGQLTGGRWNDIRLALSELLSEAQQAETSSLELRQMRPAMLEHTRASVSGLDIAKGNTLMMDYPASRFESDPIALLSDMKFESLIAYYAIRMEINRRNVIALLDSHEAAIELIQRAH